MGGYMSIRTMSGDGNAEGCSLRAWRQPPFVAFGQPRKGEAGFTLLDLLVVLGILVLVATIIGPQVLKYLGRARSDTARTQISAIASALELYALDNGGYPSGSVGLQALMVPPP